MFTAVRTLAATLALSCAAAHAGPEAQGLYSGEVGPGNAVLVALKPGAPSTRIAAVPPATLTGAYHYARSWSQDTLELSGEVVANRRVALRETLVGADGKQRQTGTFEGRVSRDGAQISGQWHSGDGRRTAPFHLTRAAVWTAQAVRAQGDPTAGVAPGVRTCERPQFIDARYTRVNQELAEACDAFLADGSEGAGKLSLHIDSLGEYLVAAVAYATSGGRELPPEVITVDLGSTDDSTTASLPFSTHARASATRP
jgi:hypothetical protein